MIETKSYQFKLMHNFDFSEMEKARGILDHYQNYTSLSMYKFETATKPRQFPLKKKKIFTLFQHKFNK